MSYVFFFISCSKKSFFTKKKLNILRFLGWQRVQQGVQTQCQSDDVTCSISDAVTIYKCHPNFKNKQCNPLLMTTAVQYNCPHIHVVNVNVSVDMTCSISDAVSIYKYLNSKHEHCNPLPMTAKVQYNCIHIHFVIIKAHIFSTTLQKTSLSPPFPPPPLLQSLHTCFNYPFPHTCIATQHR